VARTEKKYFDFQYKVQSMKEPNLFSKKVPCWASDFEKLAKVSKLQYKILSKLGATMQSWILPQTTPASSRCKDTTAVSSSVTVPDATSICTCGNLYQCCSVKTLNEEAQVAFKKLEQLKKESQLRRLQQQKQQQVVPPQ